jgi:Domain of unknown function (DUF4416)
MADRRLPDPALLVVAAFSRHEHALAWARERLESAFGPVGLASEPYEFHQTTYYEGTMGAGLRKQLLALRHLTALDDLSRIKKFTNDLEQQLAQLGTYPEARPLNLDPGMLTLGKFMLATTKDQAHRIYLREGIYAEVTLRFQGGAFEPWPWTYADYREPHVRGFLGQARDYYRDRLREDSVTGR